MSRQRSVAANDRPTIHLASGSGGHFDLLRRLGASLGDVNRVWITQPSNGARVLANEGQRVLLLPSWDRSLRRGKIATNVVRSARMAFSERPKVVVTTGSGLVVPVCVFARLLGARIIFVETSARSTNASRAGRVLNWIASRTLVQWPKMTSVYRGSVCCRPSLLDEVSEVPLVRGIGTFVAVGTTVQPFDRLLATVDDAVGRGVLPHPVVAQGGVSLFGPAHYTLRDWLSSDEMEAGIAAAEVVVCHAGTGSISAALRNGRRPLVMARRPPLEHFDAHQDQLVTELARMDLVVPISDTIEEAHVTSSARPLSFGCRAEPTLTLGDALGTAVRDLL